MQAQHLFPLTMAVQFTPIHITPTYRHSTKKPSFKAKTHTPRVLHPHTEEGRKKSPSQSPLLPPFSLAWEGAVTTGIEGYACPWPNSLVQCILSLFFFEWETPSKRCHETLFPQKKLKHCTFSRVAPFLFTTQCNPPSQNTQTTSFAQKLSACYLQMETQLG